MAKLFGTDGVRGVANRDLTPDLAFRLGRVGATVLARHGGLLGSARPLIGIGRDTRISGQMLEAALVAGITSTGADVVLLGVLPTPGVAYLTRAMGLAAGVMISASHNPAEDNGIKFFSGDGYKLSDALEHEIESEVVRLAGIPSAQDGLPRPTGGDVGRVLLDGRAWERYGDYLCTTVQGDLSGLRVVVDCANGAASELAPWVLSRLGAEVIPMHNQPTGTNINVNCGSTHPESMQAAVRAHRAHVGLAHDGDADRLIAADENGDLVDGDHILAICARHLLKTGALPHKTIAATVYSNLGLSRSLEEAGGRVVVTKAGDRYVLEAMREQGLLLGGEQSGHIIFLAHNTTGDGVLTALQLLALIKASEQPLSNLAKVMQTFPQVLRNVKVSQKEWEANAAIQSAIKQAEGLLEGQGRVFVRASGTEPLIRVMVEGPHRERVEQAAQTVANVIMQELGGQSQ